MSIFSDTKDLPKLNQKDIKILCTIITRNEFDTLIKRYPDKEKPSTI